MGASLQARGEKGIFNSYSKIQNSKCCQLILRKLQIVRAFFNRKSYFACWLLQQFVGYAKSLFLCSTSLWRFFLTESSCVVILVGGGAVLLCNFSTLIISQRSLWYCCWTTLLLSFTQFSSLLYKCNQLSQGKRKDCCIAFPLVATELIFRISFLY